MPINSFQLCFYLCYVMKHPPVFMLTGNYNLTLTETVAKYMSVVEVWRWSGGGVESK